MQYLVQWSIDIYAETPQQAAKIARCIQLDPCNIATEFVVSPEGNPDNTTIVDVAKG